VADRTFLSWPFFTDRHRALADGIERWCAANLPVDHGDVDAACRDLVKRLGRDGWLMHTAPDPQIPAPPDVRTLCLMRETLARHDGLADFAFAMQGLGAGPISFFGGDEQRAWLKRTRAGEAISAFALTEPASGSDVANIAMTARLSGNHYVLDGEKTWISNGGIADVYVVFARTGEAPGAKGLSAFVVPGDVSGLSVAERLDVIAPHPLARLKFDAVRVPAAAMIGAPGEGFKIAMATLDVFRPSVPPRWALPAARSRKPSPAPVHGNCSAGRSPICRWCKATSPTWRSTSMPPRCWSIAPPGPRIPARRG
jgi:acyl-CoA dehydrogenase